MKTEQLIGLLATDVPAVPRDAAARRLGLALGAALPLSAAGMLAGYGLRPDLAQVLSLPMFWIKLAFPLCIAAAAFAIVQRLARPGVPVRRGWAGLAAPVLLLWALALVVWFGAPAADRGPMFWGLSWRGCIANIALLALPFFVAVFLALRGLAPTRPALAGAAAGALAGGLGAAVYALHCQELAAPFLAVWYVAGIALPTVVGAGLGHRLLRW